MECRCGTMKHGSDFQMRLAAPKALRRHGISMAIKPGWIPPRSPYSLIQEDIFPDEWLMLIVCMMLNCTRRKQVEKVLPEFRKRWPTPQDFLRADIAEIEDVCRPLGFAVRRTHNMRSMTERYLAAPWQRARELPGIGEYAAASWEIFCQGVFQDKSPNDHALTQYYNWFKQQRKRPRTG